MRVVLQRVQRASVSIDGEISGAIGRGILVFLGIEEGDGYEDIEWLAKKIANLRIFNDEEGKMNLSVQDVAGDILLVSQFTLHASTKKGNRPSYIRSAHPDKAVPLYERMHQVLEETLDKPIATGKFGAHMEVELFNDGPVTITIDTKNKE